MYRRGALVFGFATLLACTVGDEGGSSFSAGGSASADPSAESLSTATEEGGPSETGGTADHGADHGSDDVDDGASTGADASASSDAADGDDTSSGGGSETASNDDGESSSTGTPNDLDDGILDIVVTAHDDCTFTTVPTSITVPEGTEFTVNWISAASSAIEFDIAKIDPFNQVPIVIGMEPGTAYHDEVRSWCGALFTGTFEFRVTSCYDPQYIPVDCGG